MNVIYGLENVETLPEGRAVAVGVFDGVHLGHQAIFRNLREIASDRNIGSMAFTFDRHPAELLAPIAAPKFIGTINQRIEMIRTQGVEETVIADFSPELANLPRKLFVERVLIRILSARHIVVGSNFRFGHNREGNVDYLAEVAPDMGLGLTVVPSIIVAGGAVSSTRIRALVGSGDVQGAAKLLGRRFTLRGVVIMGRQIGRTIGFPTANLSVEPRQLLPSKGVYAVEVRVGNNDYPGVCNIGSRPTFDAGALSIEVHLSGFSGNIYGERLDVAFCRRLRDEMKFESPQSLADQIRIDLERANRSCVSGDHIW